MKQEGSSICILRNITRESETGLKLESYRSVFRKKQKLFEMCSCCSYLQIKQVKSYLTRKILFVNNKKGFFNGITTVNS